VSERRLRSGDDLMGRTVDGTGLGARDCAEVVDCREVAGMGSMSMLVGGGGGGRNGPYADCEVNEQTDDTVRGTGHIHMMIVSLS
jgi:hypothetical protein